jgi:TATA-binding protein-associated factor Taf7
VWTYNRHQTTSLVVLMLCQTRSLLPTDRELLMPRQRMYSSNAERQAAYRDRLNQRQALAESGQMFARLAELEAALAAMTRRAQTAEQRAARAEAQNAELRDTNNRRDATPVARPDRTPAGPKGRDQVRLFAALQHIAELEDTIAELQQQLSVAKPPATRAPGANRAARLAAERDQRRRH